MAVKWEGSTSWVDGLLITTAVLLLWSAGRWIYDRLTMPEAESKAPKLPHPPFRLPVLGDTLSATYHTPHFYDWLTTLQDTFQNRPNSLKIIGVPLQVVLATPELFEDVLKRQFDCFDKGPRLHEILADLFGNGIFSVDGHRWVHQRKTASNLFTTKTLRESMTQSVRKLLPIMHTIFSRHASTQEPIDMVKLLNRFTVEFFAKIGFGVELGCLDAPNDHAFQAAFDGAQRCISLRLIRPRFLWKAMRWLSIGCERDLKQHINAVDDMVYGIISQSLKKRASSSSNANETVQQSIVSLFLDGVNHSKATSDNTDAQEPIDPIFIRDIVVSFTIAGRDTTAQALSWFLYLLSQHPKVERKLRTEMELKREQFGGCSLDALTMEQAQELVYLEATIKETLRLYPSVPNNVKHANRDTVLYDGTFIKAGTAVLIPSYVMGRMEQVWGPDAKQFKPERWIDPQTGRIITLSAYKFNSFHAGPRMCLGMNLAMMEMKMVAASLLSKFELELVPGQHITYDMSLTLPMKGAMFMRVKPVEK